VCTEYEDVCHYEGRRAAAMRPLAELLLTLVYNYHDNPYALNKFRIIMLTSFDEYLGQYAYISLSTGYRAKLVILYSTRNNVHTAHP